MWNVEAQSNDKWSLNEGASESTTGQNAGYHRFWVYKRVQNAEPDQNDLKYNWPKCRKLKLVLIERHLQPQMPPLLWAIMVALITIINSDDDDDDADEDADDDDDADHDADDADDADDDADDDDHD